MEWEDIRKFRSSTPESVGVKGFETMAQFEIEKTKSSFMHFHGALAMWTKHPHVTDAMLMESAFRGEGFFPNPLLAEVICTRPVKSLLSTRNVFQQLYGITLEKKLKNCIPHTLEHQVLRVLLTGIERKQSTDNEFADYRSDFRDVLRIMKNGGPRETTLGIAIAQVEFKPTKTQTAEKYDSDSDKIDAMICKEYEQVFGTKLSEGVNFENVRSIFKLRRDPVSHFAALLSHAFEKGDAEILTRVIVTRALVDLAEIKDAFSLKFGRSLEEMVGTFATGSYKGFLQMLMAYPREGDEFPGEVEEDPSEGDK